MLRLDLHDSWVVHVVVVIVRYNDGVNVRNIFDLTGHVRIALGTQPCEWARRSKLLAKCDT